MMTALYVIVVKARTNKLLHPYWRAGVPVARGVGEFTGGPTFYVRDDRVVEAYETRGEAEDEIALRKGSFSGVDFEVVEFRR